MIIEEIKHRALIVAAISSSATGLLAGESKNTNASPEETNKSWLWIGRRGKPVRVYLAAITQALARTLERRRMSNAGIIRCASGLAGLYAKCFFR